MLLVALHLVALAAPAPDVLERCKVAVLDLAPGEGVTVERARSFTEVVTSEIGARLHSGGAVCSVLSRAEIRALLSFEVERQLSGCDASSCHGVRGSGNGPGRSRVAGNEFTRCQPFASRSWWHAVQSASENSGHS